MMDGTSSLASTNLLIGIDDTDTRESSGTSTIARRLLEAFDESRMGAPLGATSHQLVQDAAVPYTSQNTSVCLAIKASHRLEIPEFIDYVAPFLESESALGSNPGLAVAREAAWNDPGVAERLVAYGRSAKSDVLDVASAFALAGEVGVHLSGHGGTNAGVVGALAALGLHISGSDGRFVWMPGIRDLSGKVTYRQLQLLAPIDAALDEEGQEPAGEDVIDLGDWVRPVLMDGRSVLLLDPPTTVTAAAGFGARPKPVTTWKVSGPDAVRRH
jgi:hypothetical protein